MRRWWLLAGVVAAVLATAGCGLPLDERPRDIAAMDEPFPLQDTVGPRPETGQGADTIKVYLVGPDTLVASDRPGPGDVAEAVRQLLLGPTQEDSNRGLQSSVPPNTRLLGVETAVDGTVTVDLSSEFLDVRGEAQIAAVAQLVFTVTGVPGVTGLLLKIAGEPKAIPTESGTADQLVPVGRFDYPSLFPISLPEPVQPSATTTTVPEQPSPGDAAAPALTNRT